MTKRKYTVVYAYTSFTRNKILLTKMLYFVPCEKDHKETIEQMIFKLKCKSYLPADAVYAILKGHVKNVY